LCVCLLLSVQLMSLRKLGFVDVLLAVDGTECVAAVSSERAAGRGDMLLVLMDSSMEPMDGLEATRIIRQTHTEAWPSGAPTTPEQSPALPFSPAAAAAAAAAASPLLSPGVSPVVPSLRRFTPPFIIAQTANVTVEAQRACIAAGTDHFLPKPVRLDALVAALRIGHRALHAYRHVHQQQQRSNDSLLGPVAMAD
jgi:CheY-like chemotaxis protein